jgi:hypothetical protein
MCLQLNLITVMDAALVGVYLPTSDDASRGYMSTGPGSWTLGLDTE